MSRLILAAALAVTACNPLEMGKAREASLQGVADFHAQFNAAKFPEISAAVAEGFPAKDRPTFADLLGAVHRKLGKVLTSDPRGWQVRSFNLRTLVVMQQATTFEHGQGTETFQWTVSDGKARLLGYTINSQDLILK